MKGRGQWANRVLDDSDIERTPEYEEFMKKLQEYHDERGTVLTPEPELGRKRLDLLKLYKKVTEAGGYDHCTTEKGVWRDLAQSYKLAANNTNAGYLLKTIYYKNLAAYEIKTFHGKEPPPKELVEDRSAAGGPIMTRTFENTPPEGSPDTEAKEEDLSMSPSAVNTTQAVTTNSGRTLRQAPPQRQFYQPPVTTPRATSKTATAGPSQQQQPHQQTQQPQPTHQTPPQHPNGASSVNPAQSWTPPNSVPAHYSGTSLGPVPRPVITPANSPQAYMNQRQMTMPLTRAPKLGAGHPGASLMTRVTMGLRSGLPDEVAFALTNLVRISFEHGDSLKADDYPGMTEALVLELSRLTDFTRGSSKDITDTIETPENQKKLNIILEAALILRNMSINVENAKYMASLKLCRSTIVEGVNIPPHSTLTELKHYCLDIAEAMCPLLSLADNGELFKGLVAGLDSDDRGILIASLRGITRLVHRDETNRLKSVNLTSIRRVQDLLLLEDEELLLASLDFLYQYTVMDENIAVLMSQPTALGFLNQLKRLLLHQAEENHTTYSLRPRAKIPPPTQIPNLPQEIVNELLGFPEPERATKWMRTCFTPDSDCDITQIALWQSYQARFTPYVNIRPLLAAADFIKNVSVAFSEASAMVLSMPPGTQKFIIKGIKPRLTPLSPSGVDYLACQWTVGAGQHPENIMGRCQEMLPSPQDLFSHILDAHLTPPPPGEGANMTLCCFWAECHRFPPPGSSDRRSVIAHVRTHMPDTKRPDSKPGVKIFKPVTGTPVDNPVSTIQKNLEEYLPPSETLVLKKQVTTVDERGDAAGVALTAALVMRNIARASGMGAKLVGEYFRGGLEGDCHEVATLNQPLSQYLYDLLIDRFEEEEMEKFGEREKKKGGVVVRS